MSDVNPYATPKAMVEDADAGSPAEALRQEHIRHEASIKSAGWLFMLGGALVLFSAAATVIPQLTGSGGSRAGIAIGAGFALLAATSIAVGWGLRALRAWARVPAIMLAAVGLLGFPIGTLINGYILWLILSRKGRMVLSAEYAAIVAATPHVRYRTSLVVWIVLAILVLMLVALILAPSFR